MADAQRPAAIRPETPTRAAPPTSRLLSATSGALSIPSTAARPLSGIGPLSPVNQNGSFAFDRVIKSGKVQRRVKKKGAWKSSWKAAYLVLRPNLLSVYKDENEAELRVSITLSDVTAVAPVKKTNHDNVFGIFSPTKNYHFSAQSDRETSDWITMIRMEARTEEQEDLQPPNAGFRQGENAGYETTDLSADDDLEPPGSPEAPHWNVRGSKTRIAPQANADPRKTSHPVYSGNESFATSQSDFSDGLSSSIPGSKGYLSSSVPVQPSSLAPILDDTPSTSRPMPTRGTSYLNAEGHNAELSKSAPKQLPHSLPSQDPNASRIIRQGYLKLAKTISGVRQWKTVFLILRLSALSFYKSPHDNAPFFSIPAARLIDAAEIDRKHKQNCFQVIGDEKTHKFRAETEDDLESWLGAFKSVIFKSQQQQHHHEGDIDRDRERSNRSRGNSTSQGLVLPSSRDGAGRISGIEGQMRNVSLETSSASARRVVSPPATNIHAQAPSAI